MSSLSKAIYDRFAQETHGRKLPRAERKALMERITRELRERLCKHQVSKRPPYGNCAVLSPDGVLMFRCHEGRFQWYLTNTDCDLVSEEPRTLRLNFQPTGPGYICDDYHLQERVNACVACGAKGVLNRHHVLPRCFRRHYPRSYARHNGHDVVPLCMHCHHAYEPHAERLKKEIAAELGLTVNTSRTAEDPNLGRVVRFAWTVDLHGKGMPPQFLEPMLEVLREHLGKKDITPEDLRALRKFDPRRPNPAFVEYGKIVVERSNLEELLKRWRRHFVEVLKPSFLPAGWSVERPFAMDLEEDPKPWPSTIARARKAAGAPANVPWHTFMSRHPEKEGACERS